MKKSCPANAIIAWPPKCAPPCSCRAHPLGVSIHSSPRAPSIVKCRLSPATRGITDIFKRPVSICNCSTGATRIPIRMSLSIPPAPWHLTGQAVAFLASPFTLRLLVNYASSPVGSYLEHALAVPTWLGPRVIRMSVDSELSKIGGRAIWGYPKTLENLSWQRDGKHLVFRREKQTFRLRICGPSFPIAAPFWTVQTLNGENVRVPAHIKARVKLAFRGRQIAIFVEEFSMTFEPPQPI